MNLQTQYDTLGSSNAQSCGSATPIPLSWPLRAVSMAVAVRYPGGLADTPRFTATSDNSGSNLENTSVE